MGYQINPDYEKKEYMNFLGDCPYCGKTIDGSKETNENGDAPEFDDVGVCFFCGGFLIINKNLKVEMLPFDKFRSLNEKTRAILMAYHLRLKISKQVQGETYETMFDLNEYLSGYVD